MTSTLAMTMKTNGAADGAGGFHQSGRAFRNANGNSVTANPEVVAATGKLKKVLETIQTKIVGRDKDLTLMLVALLAGGHILLECSPGMAKTLTAEVMSKVLNLDSKRIQFTPDIMPSDMIGSEVKNPDPDAGPDKAFIFIKGPIFTQLLLGDEGNRGSPRSQSALLQIMQEKKVTYAGIEYSVPEPFNVVFTQNQLEQEGTNPLPEAQLDRFMLKIVFPELSEEESLDLLKSKAARKGAPSDHREVSIEPVLEKSVNGSGEHELIHIQRLMNEHVVTPEPVLKYIVRLARGMKPHVEGAKSYIRDSFIEQSASGERAAESLLNAASAYAFINGKTTVEITDVQEVAEAVLIHRAYEKPGSRGDKMEPQAAIKKLAQEMILG